MPGGKPGRYRTRSRRLFTEMRQTEQKLLPAPADGGHDDESYMF